LARFSEAIRGLRSGIQMTDVDHPPKVLQIASAVPKEGKTTVALAMARSAALTKARVLFIDADLRHPSASRMFDLGKQPGLVELLLGQAGVEDAARFEEKVGHWILPAGGNTQTPSDLLGSARMKSLVMGLREEFDLIVIDSPPVGPVIDPIVVSQLVDKV